MKQAGGSHAPPAAGSAVTYLHQPPDTTPFSVTSPAAYVAAVGRVARGRVTEVAAALLADREVLPEAQAWNQSLVQLEAAALVRTDTTHFFTSSLNLFLRHYTHFGPDVAGSC